MDQTVRGGRALKQRRSRGACHGLMAAVMLSRAGDFEDVKRRASYAGIFLTLLFTIALKADLEALAVCGMAWSFGPVVPWLTGATLAKVVGGLGLAFVHARDVPIPWQELRYPTLKRSCLRLRSLPTWPLSAQR